MLSSHSYAFRIKWVGTRTAPRLGNRISFTPAFVWRRPPLKRFILRYFGPAKNLVCMRLHRSMEPPISTIYISSSPSEGNYTQFTIQGKRLTVLLIRHSNHCWVLIESSIDHHWGSVERFYWCIPTIKLAANFSWCANKRFYWCVVAIKITTNLHRRSLECWNHSSETII